MILVKLGGSVITNKNRLRSFQRRNCMRLCGELQQAKEALMLVHGAGSFGHILALKAKLQLGIEKGDLEKLRQVAHVHRDVRELNHKVLDCMTKKELKGFSVPPYSVASFSSGEVVNFCPDAFQQLLERKIIPVSFGDVVPDKELTFSICSGDLMMSALAEHFHPEKVVFVADVDGVFDSDPIKNRSAKLIETLTKDNVDEITGESSGSDVTGAMAGKISRMIEIARHCENCMILNGNAAGRLEKALKGQKIISTRVVY